MKTAELAALYITCLLGIMPIAASAQPYAISTDGSEVTDQKTGLIWRRCAEGMVVSGGTCTGSASGFTQEAALRHAAALTGSTGKAWRLPNIKELSSIADKSRSNPAIDPTAFPATPTSAPNNAAQNNGFLSASGAWVVNFSDGSVRAASRSSFIDYVRLVRDGQ